MTPGGHQQETELHECLGLAKCYYTDFNAFARPIVCRIGVEGCVEGA